MQDPSASDSDTPNVDPAPTLSDVRPSGQERYWWGRQKADGLRREVMPPTKSHNGLGALIVASAAMFFAVAGSAFALRASTADCPYQDRGEDMPAAAVAPAPVAKSAKDTCGSPVYHRDSDGTYSVFFEVCPDDAPVLIVHEP